MRGHRFRNPERKQTVGLLATCSLVASLSMISPVRAQSIPTPAGELRVGMTESAVTRLFQKPVQEEKANDGTVLGRTVGSSTPKRGLWAKLTRMGLVYSIAAEEWFPEGTVGKQAAEQMFRRYLQDYRAPADPATVMRNPRIPLQGWKNAQGLTVVIGLHCDETALTIEVSDYQHQFADDGIRDDRQQRMGPGIDTWCF